MGVEVGQRVRVYRNLNKGGYSVLVRGRVVDRVDELHLSLVDLVVQPGGRARARREKRRNVHAFAVGVVMPAWDFRNGTQLRYNAFENERFIRVDTGAEVTYAAYAHLGPNGIFALSPRIGQ